MKNLKIKFCPDLEQMLLKGATIINYYNGNYQITILVRLPKGEFYTIKNDKREFENIRLDKREFEYIQFDQNKDMDMYHAVSRNGHIREVKRKVSDSHYKDEVHYQMMADRKKTNI